MNYSTADGVAKFQEINPKKVCVSQCGKARGVKLHRFTKKLPNPVC